MEFNRKAKPEYATAKIAVWWDMKDCPVPEGYDACRVRPSLEEEFKKLGYYGPVSITAYKQTPGHLLRGLFSTGVAIGHSITKNTCSNMFSDILKWRSRNPPPATMMLISDHIEDLLCWDLARLQQETKYNLFRASSVRIVCVSLLVSSAMWVWEKLLRSTDEITSTSIIQERSHLYARESSADVTTTAFVLKRCSQLSASESSADVTMFYCKSCSFDCRSLASFRKHLSSCKHVVKPEVENNCGNGEFDPVTRMWARNYPAKPEYATTQISVWWDMIDCPIPEGYDARWVRPSIEREFKKLGYSGPVFITAFADHKQTPDHVLRGLSSTGVSVAHTIPENIGSFMNSDLSHRGHCNTMMLISNHVEESFSHALVQRQQVVNYNLFLAYSFRPYKMSILVTSAEWLWDTLLAVSETRRHVLQMCRRGESTGMFSCQSCFCDCEGLDDFRKHLSSQEHTQEASMDSGARLWQRKRNRFLKDQHYKPKSKRLRKAPWTGFRPFHNHLRPKRRARSSAVY